MAAYSISDMMSFDNIADDDAIARRDQVNSTISALAPDGTKGAVSGMMAMPNDYSGQYSPGYAWAANISRDLGKALQASGLGSMTGRR